VRRYTCGNASIVELAEHPLIGTAVVHFKINPPAN
jgi:hypothetical protein